MKGVGGRVNIVLELVIAPPVSAKLMAEVLVDWDRGIEGWLPV